MFKSPVGLTSSPLLPSSTSFQAKTPSTSALSSPSFLLVSPSTTAASNSPFPPSPATPLPPVTIHSAAQTGDLQSLTALLSPSAVSPTPSSSSTSIVTPNDLDAQGCRPLQWSSINNHLLATKFLLEKGAEVDATGGELNATALHWAARSVLFPPLSGKTTSHRTDDDFSRIVLETETFTSSTC